MKCIGCSLWCHGQAIYLYSEHHKKLHVSLGGLKFSCAILLPVFPFVSPICFSWLPWKHYWYNMQVNIPCPEESCVQSPFHCKSHWVSIFFLALVSKSMQHLYVLKAVCQTRIECKATFAPIRCVRTTKNDIFSSLEFTTSSDPVYWTVLHITVLSWHALWHPASCLRRIGRYAAAVTCGSKVTTCGLLSE